jgi:hypothetical protein
MNGIFMVFQGVSPCSPKIYAHDEQMREERMLPMNFELHDEKDFLNFLSLSHLLSYFLKHPVYAHTFSLKKSLAFSLLSLHNLSLSFHSKCRKRQKNFLDGSVK